MRLIFLCCLAFIECARQSQTPKTPTFPADTTFSKGKNSNLLIPDSIDVKRFTSESTPNKKKKEAQTPAKNQGLCRVTKGKILFPQSPTVLERCIGGRPPVKEEEKELRVDDLNFGDFQFSIYEPRLDGVLKSIQRAGTKGKEASAPGKNLALSQEDRPEILHRGGASQNTTGVAVQAFSTETLSRISYPWVTTAPFKAYVPSEFLEGLNPRRVRLKLLVWAQDAFVGTFDVVGSTDFLPNHSKNQVYLTDATCSIFKFPLKSGSGFSVQLDYVLADATHEVMPYRDRWSLLSKITPFYAIVPRKLLQDANFFELKLSFLLNAKECSLNFRVVGAHSIKREVIFINQEIFEKLLSNKEGILAAPEILPIQSFGASEGVIEIESLVEDPFLGGKVDTKDIEYIRGYSSKFISNGKKLKIVPVKASNGPKIKK